MTLGSTDPDRLLKLLPALYRTADAAENDELAALLRLVGAEADALRADVEQLWNDFFIETSQQWVVSYIGDLVGNVPLHDLDGSAAAATAEAIFTDLAGPDLRPPGTIPTRADVARTIYYRRRKGTPAMLEELARDVTGWGAHIVEFFQLLDWNQHLEHLRTECEGCPDLRRVDVCDRVGGAWDSTMHTVDVRPINAANGWYDVSNVGLFLWRLDTFALLYSTPRPIGGDPWRLTFSPLGQDTPLFSPGTREPGASGIASELSVKLPIRPAAFFEDLSAATIPPVAGDLLTGYYGDPSVAALAVYVVGPLGEFVQVDDVRCVNLANWGAMAQPAGSTVGIDPTRGRLVVPTGLAGKEIVVSWSYGFSAPLGGGTYPRGAWLAAPRAGDAPVPVTTGTDLDAAVVGRGAHSVFEIRDDASYTLSTPITVGAGESLVIQAADGCRPHVRLDGGELHVLSGGDDASLTLNGLLVEGALLVDGDLKRLRLLHTTLVPGRSVEQEAPPAGGPSLVVAATDAHGAAINTNLELQLAYCIVGALRVPSRVAMLWLLDSIVDGAVAVSDDAGTNGPPAHIERSTLLGASFFLKLELGSDSIFAETVTVKERQAGCVRFSWLPAGSSTPQRYRCQPALEIDRQTERTKADAARTGTTLPPGWDDALAATIVAWLVPGFVSVQYGRPEYAQLRLSSPEQIRTGAEDGSEMGAFSVLKQPQREANLRLRLGEYLPVGLEAGLLYVT